MGNAYQSLGQYQEAIKFHQQSLEIQRDIGNRNGEANSLNNLGNAYQSLGEYQEAIEFYQQSLEIQRKIGNRYGEANSWFNLGNTLSKLKQQSEALEAYHHARQLYQAMGLDSRVQACDNAIEKLSQGDGGWLNRIFRLFR